MPILFKCECGAPGVVPDESAGQNYTCHTCGRTGVIPSESSDDCVLVFKDGFPNEGVPYDKADFLVKLSERFFTGHDLVFVNGAWIPISVVYEVPALPAPPPPNGVEIATTFAELPPVPGVYAEAMKKSPKRHARRMKFLTSKVLPAVAILLVVLYFVLFKPLMNRRRWRCAYVMVFNPDSKAYTAELAGRKQTLPANGSCQFQDLMPWFFGKRTLVLTAPDGSIIYKVKVPLLPDYDVVVSPEAKLKLDAFESDVQRNDSAESVKTDALLKELDANAVPASLHSIGNELYDIGIKQHINSLDNVIFSSSQYSFSHIGLTRSPKYMEKRKTANLQRPGKPELVRGGIRFNIQNANFIFDLNEKNSPFTLKLPKGVKLPPKQVCEFIKKSQTDKGVKPEALISVQQSSKADTLFVSYEAKGAKMNVVMEFSGEVASKQHRYSGKWKYTAVQTLSGTDSGKWNWDWRFNGKLVTKYSGAQQPPIEIVYSRAMDGKENVSVTTGAVRK